MSNFDARQTEREDLFLLAQLRVGSRDEAHQVKVRNLSAGGTMAEGEVNVTRGELVSIELGSLGWVQGMVAWRQDSRFGIAFVEDIDPEKARGPAASASAAGPASGSEPQPGGDASAAPSAGASLHTLRKS